jgi:hypothetical protein
MTRTQKIFYLILIMIFTIGNFIFLTAIWSTIRELINFAQADPQLSGNYAANFSWYKHFLGFTPFLLYFFCPVIGIIEAIAVMRSPEIIEYGKRQYRRISR